MVAGEAEFRGAVEAWIADDPDAGDRAELRALLDRAYGSAETGPGVASGVQATTGKRMAAMRPRSRNCGTGSRGGSSSGRPGCGVWSPPARTG